MDPGDGPVHDEQLPAPTLWPVGFAIGIVVVLVGLIVDPLWISTIGAVITIAFGGLWARGATSGLRAAHAGPVEAEHRAAAAPAPAADVPHAETGDRFPRSKFLEGATLGLGGVIGGILTVPVAGFAILPSFLGQKGHEVDLGPVSELKEGQWYVATFTVDPAEAEVSRRTAFVRNNGTATVNGKTEPSFTIISNRCAHLGCPVQANGPTGAILGLKTIEEKTANGPLKLEPVVPAGFGCPCHGGQYDTEGNRTAGPPVRGLDRYDFEIKNGRLVLLSQYSVSHVDGTGAQAAIHKYKLAGPGEHVSGIEQILYPLQPPHH
ncbi:MAG TPA: Rieske 2Fe-2S domain-containing protein [Gaiellaceae bacterium]|nr:Rieske 2Fe-2S domain-containing protein [Gaiellaceae bacterium]